MIVKPIVVYGAGMTSAMAFCVENMMNVSLAAVALSCPLHMTDAYQSSETTAQERTIQG